MMFSRIWQLLNRPRLERELEEEMAAHREQLPPEERARFGSPLRLREQARDAWGWNWLDDLARDLRIGCRSLRRAPGFTVATAGVLALGLGVALTAFQALNLLVLRPLPVRSPENLFSVTLLGPNSSSSVLSYPAFAFLRDHNRPLTSVFAHASEEVLIDARGESAAAARFVTPNYLAELGAQPTYGRLLSLSDGAPDAPSTITLSHAYWKRAFGSDPSVVGRAVRINGQLAVVTGVAAAGFSGAAWEQVDVWAPIEQHARFFPDSNVLGNAQRRMLRVFARLRSPYTPAAAEEDLRPLVAEMRKLYPNSAGESQRFHCEPSGRPLRLRDGSETFALCCALVILALAISFSNAGALQLARALARSKEIFVRSSLGAGRFRIVRQLATEAVLLGALGSVAGLLLSQWCLAAILRVVNSPLAAAAAFDWRSALAAVALALGATVFSSMAPAIHILRPNHQTHRLRSVLIGGQVAATCVLLILAGLVTRGLQSALSTPLGFEFRSVMAVDLGFHDRKAGETVRQRLTYEELQQRISELPGMRSAALCSITPLSDRIWIEGIEDPAGQYLMARANSVEPAYFETMRVPLLAGRSFRPGERKAAIVSEALARKAWPGQNPLGKPLREGTVVVGVAANSRALSLTDSDAFNIYFPFESRGPQAGAVLLASVNGDPRTHMQAVRSVLVAAGNSAARVSLLRDRFDRLTGEMRRGAAVIGLVGLMTLIIASVGLGGLLSYAVSQRRREIGIRIALGASRAEVAGTVLAKGARPVGIGLLIGAAGGYAASSLVRDQIFGIGRLDPLAYSAAICLLLAAALLAASAPLRRALRVNPADALRNE